MKPQILFQLGLWLAAASGKSSLTLFILMDFPMHVDRISMELPILYFKGSRVEVSKLLCISVEKICLYLCR